MLRYARTLTPKTRARGWTFCLPPSLPPEEKGGGETKFSPRHDHDSRGAPRTASMVVRFSGIPHAAPRPELVEADIPFAIVSIVGKGLGAQATRDIQQGERIFAEAPLVVCGSTAPRLSEVVGRLSAASRQIFFALAQNSVRFGDVKTPEGIIATNAIPFREQGKALGGLFATLSRLNHSCASNCVYKWNSNIKMLTCHACRKIPAGAELTFNYGFEDAKGSSIYMSREGRRRRLYYSFGFECSCEKCSLVGAALQQSEQNIAEIGDDKQLLGEMKQRCKADSTQAPVSDWAFLRFTRSLHFSVSPCFLHS